MKQSPLTLGGARLEARRARIRAMPGPCRRAPLLDGAKMRWRSAMTISRIRLQAEMRRFREAERRVDWRRKTMRDAVQRWKVSAGDDSGVTS